MNSPEREERLSVRGLLPGDADRILEIITQSPEAASWARKTIQKPAGPGERAWVIESGGRIEGFLVVRIVVDEAEILNMAVDQSARRTGRATALLQESFRAWGKAGVQQVFLEVRESNAAAIAFYTKLGFEIFGKRPGYYRDPDEAALCMKTRLTVQHQVPT
jgi:[ribosomal protein S18]-alanine N-acetyltransferase